MSSISFETKLYKIKSWTILRLPEEVSAKLPSRGMIMVTGSINGLPFKTLLEPDGRYGPGLKPSHWFAPSEKLLKDTQAKTGDSVKISIEPTNEWIEPVIPEDFDVALRKSPKAMTIWKDITPLARWDWIRWINSTKSPDTRHHRIDVLCSKMEAGKRRVCCFDRTKCTEIFLSRNGVLTFPSI